MSAEQLLEPIESSDQLDRARGVFDRIRDAMPPEARRLLGGDEWLGHPVHPMLTDLPIGFWTTASLLDLAGKRTRRAATLFVGLGVVTAAPTAAAGLVDYGYLDARKQRAAVVHAAANAAATALYAGSFMSRIRGRRGKGVVLALAGMGVATVGGFLGGHLAFGTPTVPAEVADPDAHLSPNDAPSLAAVPGGVRV